MVLALLNTMERISGINYSRPLATEAVSRNGKNKNLSNRTQMKEKPNMLENKLRNIIFDADY